MAYGQVDPNINKSDINPADRNNMALAAGYTGYEDYLQNRGSQASGGGGGGSWGGGNMQDAISQAVKSFQTAVEPAVQTLKTQVDPLKQRYGDLLKSIKGEQQVAEEKQTVVTSGELGKRGILGSSTLAQQEIQNAIRPVTSNYNSLYANTGIAQEKDINAIAQAIAQLQAGAGMQGVTVGSNLYGQEQALSAQKAQQDITNAIAQKQLENENLLTQYKIKEPYFKPTGVANGGGFSINEGGSLQEQTGGNIKPTSSFKPLSSANTSQWYNYFS